MSGNMIQPVSSVKFAGKYFRKRPEAGISYRRLVKKQGKRVNEKPPFSAGESAAFKFWSIASSYGDEEIIVDELPVVADMPDFIETYRKAHAGSFIVSGSVMDRIDVFPGYVCRIGSCAG